MFGCDLTHLTAETMLGASAEKNLWPGDSGSADSRHESQLTDGR